MKRSRIIALISLPVLLILLVVACKKYAVTVPPAQATFQNKSGGSYFITGPAVADTIPIGVTSVANVDRKINFTVTSPTGAVAGTHYNIPSTSVTIPAGKATANLVVNGVYAQYQAGRKDSLFITISSGDVTPSDFNSTYKLFMRGPCFEGDVTLTALKGTYAHTNENFGGSPYGPYTTTISAVNQLTPTTGTITVTNIFDAGWNPITFTLDWTDPANRKVTLVQQSGIGNAGTISSTYAGQDISVRPYAGQIGTFSACNQTIQLVMQTGVTGVGFFSALYVVNMAK